MTLKFTIFDESIEIDEKKDRYNSLRKDFDEFSYMQSEKFTDIFRESYYNIDVLSKNGLNDGFKLIIEGIDRALSILVDNNILDIDRKRFFSNYYGKYYSYDEDFHKINNRYLSIIIPEKNLLDYNERCKNVRLQWKEKGFPIDGSVIDVTKENNMTMASSLTHISYKFKGKTFSGIGNFIEKSKLLNDNETLEVLKTSVYNNCYNIHKALIDCFEDNGLNIYDKYIGEDIINSVEALFNNLTIGVIPQEKVQENIIKIIKGNPYELRYYKFIIYNLGDEYNELDKLADYYGVFGLGDFKLSLLKDKFNKLDLSTEESTIQGKELLTTYMHKLGIGTQNPYYFKIEERLKELDLIKRTVEDIEFPTREMASLAREDKSKIEEVLKNINSDSEEEILQALDNIKRLDLKTILKIKYIDLLNQKLKTIIEKADFLYLNTKFDCKSLYSEEEVVKALEELRNTDLRTKEALALKERDLITRLTQIIEGNDILKMENIINSYLFFNMSDIQNAVDELSSMDIRSYHLKREKIEYLLDNARFIINNHLNLLDKAKKYDIKLKEKKNGKSLPKDNGFMGSIKKVFGDTINKVNEILSEEDKRAWEFITNNGEKTIEEVYARIQER